MQLRIRFANRTLSPIIDCGRLFAPPGCDAAAPNEAGWRELAPDDVPTSEWRGAPHGESRSSEGQNRELSTSVNDDDVLLQTQAEASVRPVNRRRADHRNARCGARLHHAPEVLRLNPVALSSNSLFVWNGDDCDRW